MILIWLAGFTERSDYSEPNTPGCGKKTNEQTKNKPAKTDATYGCKHPISLSVSAQIFLLLLQSLKLSKFHSFIQFCKKET